MAVNAGEKGEKTKIWGLDASCGSSYFGMCCHVWLLKYFILILSFPIVCHICPYLILAKNVYIVCKTIWIYDFKVSVSYSRINKAIFVSYSWLE